MSGRRWLILLAVLIGGVLMVRVLNNDYVADIDADLTVVETSNVSGWVEDANTWTYSSADAPSFVISINADVTGYLSAGMRARLTQTTVKYAIITAVGSYSAGATLITVYGGTDYTIANAAISSPGYSSYKAPFGFPLNPDKWSEELVDDTQYSESTFNTNEYINLGSLSLTAPIGVWNAYIRSRLYMDAQTSSSVNVTGLIATSSSTSSSPTGIVEGSRTIFQSIVVPAPATQLVISGTGSVQFVLTQTSKQTYYYMVRPQFTGSPSSKLLFVQYVVIRLVCAYL